MTSLERTARILMIDDNAGDVRLMQEAFREAGFAYEMKVAQDGTEAFSLLRPAGSVPVLFKPDLIFLDLKLPRRNGIEILEELKTDPLLKRIPVVILSSSYSDMDIRQCYELYANCYISKPALYKDLVETAVFLKKFWFETVRLPKEH